MKYKKIEIQSEWQKARKTDTQSVAERTKDGRKVKARKIKRWRKKIHRNRYEDGMKESHIVQRIVR